VSTQNTAVLEPRQLNDADEKILDELHQGRASPSYLADRTGVEQTYINQRLRRLDEHGHVENLARGLWELADDPRTEGGEERDDVPTREIVDDWLWEHYGFGVDTLDEVDPERAQAAFEHLLEARGKVDGIDEALDELAEALGVERDG
jgi:DNA-binding Lrp family transcriptional regulator